MGSLRRLVVSSYVSLLIAYPGAAFAQPVCSTPFGSCVIVANAGPQGSPCYCMTNSGPITGFTVYNMPMNARPQMPQFCCTPAGRLGPYANNTIPVGAPCMVNTPWGQPIAGQACY